MTLGVHERWGCRSCSAKHHMMFKELIGAYVTITEQMGIVKDTTDF